MQAFGWSGIFETSVAEVDEQHQRLVRLVNDLGEEIDRGESQKIDQVLQELAHYTVYHFESEENVMQEAGLAEDYISRHKRTHRSFVEQVSQWIATRNESGQLSPTQLLDFLSNWLVFHILGDDQSMGRQILAVRAGTSPADAYARDKPSIDPRTDVLLGALRNLYADLSSRNDLLVSAQSDLKQLNATLESRVAKRTRELEEANAQLIEERQRAINTEKMASLGRMVAGFAHEINTPVGIAVGALSQELQIISGFGSLLQQDEVSEEDIRSRLEILRESSALALSNIQRAATLVQSFKRTAVDQSSDVVREFVVAQVLQDVIHNLQPLFKKTQIRLIQECAQAIQFLGTPGWLTQVFTNLFVNAYEHAFVEGTRSGTIQVCVSQNAGTLKISFRDDGVGIEGAALPKIFEPFYTTHRTRGGSGLGLYLVYNMITQKMNGTIDCKSVQGMGTEFLICLPMTTPPPTPEQK
jgi:hemerythrin-like metal-binding protein